MRKCPFCSREVSNAPHIYFCESKTTEDRREIKLLYINKNFPSLSTIEYVIDIYSNKSLPDIKREFGIDYKSFLFLLDYYNIKKRDISTSAKLISANKYKKTCRDRYGVDNVSQSNFIKNKKKDTFIKNYGVDNIFKDNEFKKWILENNFAWNNLSDEQNIERIKKQTASIKKYWNNLTDEQKNRLHYYNGTSNLETKISEVLNNLSISYVTQFPLSGKLFDFRLVNTNILIEVNGDYWHCNPIKYRKDDIVNFFGKKTKVYNVWQKDEEKRLRAEKNKFIVIYIWENEINNSKNLQELLISKLNI